MFVAVLIAMPFGAQAANPVPDNAATTLASLYHQVSPGVVRINVTKKSYDEIVAEERAKKDNGEDFYLPPGERDKDEDDEDEESKKSEEPKSDWERKRRRASTGTGFLVGDEGYIVTNEHVVRDGVGFLVLFTDGRRLRADLIGADFLTDLAVLKVQKPEDITPLVWGDTRFVNVGDPVFAVGYPYGFDQTLTSGIVSGKDRELRSGSYNPYLQTDTAVNKGNSGGPLLNMDGLVVGVNSALYTRSGGNEGLAFSIAAEHAKGIVDLLIDKGEIRRGWFGIGYNDIKTGVGRLFGLEKDEGMLIIRAPEDEPAYDAGIRVGDVIVSVNGETVTSRQHFRMMAAMAEGETTVTVWRKDGYHSLTLIPDDMDEAKSRRRAAERDKMGLGARDEDDGRKSILGMDLVPANEKAWKKLDLPVGTTGLVVDRMERASQGSQIGFNKGDFLTRANDVVLKTPEDFERVMQDALDRAAEYVVVYYRNDGEDRLKLVDTLKMIDLSAY
ncbi:S1C family serine protease [Thalassospira sp.]|uniref:S1C family serine protease n=1 Tax=Thalassospira sp. TaxID=1912094 RepID=UPI002735AEB5|nr:trypsin-like peptidase domain-containing protein [Thalassospira sp.]MDP2698380.1 trypsin-like peptidase domain-containing protein [Thalassospira sp.]